MRAKVDHVGARPLNSGSVGVVIYPLSLFSFHDIFCRHETYCSYVDNRMEVPLMCSGTAVLRSSVTFFPVPFICEVQSFRAPGEITVPRLYWVVIILPVFPNVALFNTYRSHCPNMYPNLGLWGFTVTALLILNMDTEGTNPGAHRDVVDVFVVFFFCG